MCETGVLALYRSWQSSRLLGDRHVAENPLLAMTIVGKWRQIIEHLFNLTLLSYSPLVGLEQNHPDFVV